MSTSSILTTTQLDRSLFSDDPDVALAELLLDVCSASGRLDLGLDCLSKESTWQRKQYCLKSDSKLDQNADVRKYFYQLIFLSF